MGGKNFNEITLLMTSYVYNIRWELNTDSPIWNAGIFTARRNACANLSFNSNFLENVPHII